MAIVRMDMRAPKTIKAGKYPGLLLEPELMPAKEGKEYGSVVFTFVSDHEGADIKLKRYFSQSPKAVFFLQQALETLEVPYTVEQVTNEEGKTEDVLIFDTEDVEGKRVIADISASKRDGRPVNNIEAFYLDV